MLDKAHTFTHFLHVDVLGPFHVYGIEGEGFSLRRRIAVIWPDERRLRPRYFRAKRRYLSRRWRSMLRRLSRETLGPFGEGWKVEYVIDVGVEKGYL